MPLFEIAFVCVRLSRKTYLFGRRMHVNSHRAGGGRNRPHPVTRHRNTGGCSERVAHFFAVFMTRSGCAGRTTFLLGSAVSTLSDCRQKYPELDECMAEAREKARLKMLQRIKRAAEDD